MILEYDLNILESNKIYSNIIENLKNINNDQKA